MGASIKNVALLMLFAAAVVGSSAQTTHQVLGSLGWSIPQAGSVAYTAWAANQTFRVGDTLVFNYTTGLHDVAVVTKQAFDNCNPTNPISLETNGPTSIRLNSTGEHYYICTFGTHCSLGQKLAVNVSAASAPAPAPGTPAAPTPVPAPAPAATPTPPTAAAPTPGTPTAPSPSPTPGASPPSPTAGAPPPSTGAPSLLPSGPTPASTPTPPTPTGSTTPPPPPPPGSSATSLKATGLFTTVLSVALALLY